MTKPPQQRRIPIAAQCLDHGPRLARVSSRRFFTEAETFAEIQLRVSDYYGFDAPNTLWDIWNTGRGPDRAADLLAFGPGQAEASRPPKIRAHAMGP
ncbi:MAG: hypothetical protein JRJ16_18935 [Deltaproteobacteria bacterium]|nr:hypothetical protein [Deltaproteobacteria bacterium]